MNAYLAAINLNNAHGGGINWQQPTDKEYSCLTRKDFAKLHARWRRARKWARKWKYVPESNDCDDKAYGLVEYVKDHTDNALICVVIDVPMNHDYVCVWHSETDFVFYEPHAESLTEIENPTPSRLERL